MDYRSLSKNEIKELEQNGSLCDDWSKVKVKEGFSSRFIRNVTFSGDVEIGLTENTLQLPGGLTKHSGIYNSCINNCSIGDNVLIENIRGYISDIHIGNGCIISFSGPVYCEGKSYFGHDVNANVLIETGGREVALSSKLTSQNAYLLAMYRHDKDLTTGLKRLFSEYAESQSATYSTIGENAVIVNCGEIRNVNIGPSALVSGASLLDNGTVDSNEESPAVIGNSVIARGFVTAPGSEVSEAAQIYNTYVGESARISKGFTSHDSLFFANSIMENGEACAIFAAPYSVSMHKSTLLIGGYFAFLNAGSGSNQSNHLYKLGPIHQGVIERGGALASDSYLMWPAHIGAFTFVMGRHYSHPDIEDMPFSMLIQKGNESWLTPGVNLNKVGIIRDSQKWPVRDRRKGEKRDIITHGLFTPYIISHVIKGYRFLENKKRNIKPRQEYFQYNNTFIKSSDLDRSIECYYNTIATYISETLIGRIHACGDPSQFQDALTVVNIGDISWKDIAGMITPKEGIEQIILDVKEGRVDSIDTLEKEFNELNSGYHQYEWIWCAKLIHDWYNIDVNNIKNNEVKRILELGYNAILMNGEHVLEDALKEYGDKLKVSFGVHESSGEKGAEFMNIRGEFDSNPVVAQLRKLYREKALEYHKLSTL